MKMRKILTLDSGLKQVNVWSEYQETFLLLVHKTATTSNHCAIFRQDLLILESNQTMMSDNYHLCK